MKLRDHLPSREALRKIRSLRFLGGMLFQPNLWHFNRYSVSVAAFVGVFCCFLPIPFQMVPCVLMCVWLRCNVPVSVALVWVSNPITMPPMFYFTYRLGAMILGEPERIDAKLSLTTISQQIYLIWQPLFLGSILAGLCLGSLAFVTVRLYWRWKVSRYWAQRKARKPRVLKATRTEESPPV
ncbi:MAG: DUF2062 domain-containing protein [Proteobacteria bacterium]|jgi:uncharacterized protein (DUF2062 family)|nr:DUF2062 domain-containing protein [Pseudomonadota bacterium]MDA1302447.1 DUF2062 domain-containing protein [Pseudomonadota bacterium]